MKIPKQFLEIRSIETYFSLTEKWSCGPLFPKLPGPDWAEKKLWQCWKCLLCRVIFVVAASFWSWLMGTRFLPYLFENKQPLSLFSLNLLPPVCVDRMTCYSTPFCSQMQPTLVKYIPGRKKQIAIEIYG